MRMVTFKVLKKVKGYLYLECDTDKGKIAVWGSKSNLTNIEKIENAEVPFE